jgi:predicted naringenin-chalcone synthase
MATAEKHFHVPSEEEIDKLLTDKNCIYTQKATELSVKCFRDYLREQDPDNVELEELKLLLIFSIVKI